MKHKHHIIPKHSGGTDDEDNLVYLTIEEHANEHKKLYEKYDRWQDKVEELIRMKLSESGRAGALKANKNRDYSKTDYSKVGGFKEGNQLTAKEFLLESPTGEKVKVNGLSKWCNENNLNYNSFHKGVIERKRQHKGWKLWK
jgi:uncharacterized Ntn-hydrolase superfamily protein